MKKTHRRLVGLILVLSLLFVFPPVSTLADGGEVVFAHSFQESGKESDFFEISGNTSTTKGSVSYLGKTLTTCLKIESSTSISFTHTSGGTLTLVFGGTTSASGKRIKIDGVSYTIPDTQILVANLAEGAHTVTKHDSINLYYMSYSATQGGSVDEGHTHEYTAIVTPPSCTGGGYTTYICSCSDSYTSDRTEPTGHSYKDGLCSVCGRAENAVGEITEYGGWFETAYVEWSTDWGADGYRVYVKRDTQLAWERLDDSLIRRYESYFRADAVGLAAGEYVLKVVPIENGLEINSGALLTPTITVTSHDRSGYGFDKGSPLGTASGAYNDDGTLRTDAQVIYVTRDTAKTCQATVGGTVYTGFQTILDAKQKTASKEPLAFRIIGLVTISDLDHTSSSSEGLQIKGKSSYSEMNVTIEGIGEDGTVSGFGFLIRNCSGVEIRNLGIMNFIDDGVSVDTANSNLWIHNCDFFYGNPGSDADQAKGDGSLDTKKSQYITYSYNHFFDAGKVHLVGNGDDTVNYLTFHHNWYDHSDSRHPRVRCATVHVYNNYYDGVSKYGVGATMDSDIFVEANYFRSCKYPMLISMQGSDIYNGGGYDGQGTFSGENGGMIKAFGNYISGESRFVSSKENSTHFDAVVVENRTDTLPATLSAVKGGATYNNFDTSPDFYKYSVQSAEDARATVEAYAGRMGGGDFKWTFTDADDSSYDINSALKAAVSSYKSNLLSVGGMGGSPEDTHTHSYKTSVTPPTCTEGGYTTYTCECGDTVTANQTDPTGHLFADATTEAPKTCTVCGATEGDKLPGGTDTPDSPGDNQNPGGTDTPDNPGDNQNPGGTDTPDNPGDNQNPGGTDTPDNPGDSQNPGGTDTPDNPGDNQNPGGADTPDNPDDEGEPDNPTEDDEPRKDNFFTRLFQAIANFFRRLFGLPELE